MTDDRGGSRSLTTVRHLCTVLAALFLAAAVVSFVALFDRVETTTSVLAGASAACALLAYAILLKERGRG